MLFSVSKYKETSNYLVFGSPLRCLGNLTVHHSTFFLKFSFFFSLTALFICLCLIVAIDQEQKTLQKVEHSKIYLIYELKSILIK